MTVFEPRHSNEVVVRVCKRGMEENNKKCPRDFQIKRQLEKRKVAPLIRVAEQELRSLETKVDLVSHRHHRLPVLAEIH